MGSRDPFAAVTLQDRTGVAVCTCGVCVRVRMCLCVRVSEGVFVYMHSDACYWAFVAMCGVPALLSYILFISKFALLCSCSFFSLHIFFCLAHMSSAETETYGRLSCSCPASTASAAIPMCFSVRFCRCLHHDGLWLLCKKKKKKKYRHRTWLLGLPMPHNLLSSSSSQRLNRQHHYHHHRSRR